MENIISEIKKKESFSFEETFSIYKKCSSSCIDCFIKTEADKIITYKKTETENNKSITYKKTETIDQFIKDYHAGKACRPDMILHQRGGKKNMLVYEIKKNPSDNKETLDFIKLSAFTCQQRGVSIQIQTRCFYCS